MVAETLPRWNMSSVFPSLDSQEYIDAVARYDQSIAQMEERFDAAGIRRTEALPWTDAVREAADSALAQWNELLERQRVLMAYTHCFVACDSRDELAQAKLSELSGREPRIGALIARFTGWIGAIDVEQWIAQSPLAADHAFAIRKQKTQASKMMSEPEEILASELGQYGGRAWSRFYGNFSSQIMVALHREGKTETIPMSMVRNLAFDPDRNVREAAYHAELDAWKANALPIAAAMNSLKGATMHLAKKRGWGDPLNAALFENHIDRETLDAMMGAARRAFPDFRRFYKAKAKVLGLSQLTWYDLYAPVGASKREWNWDEAVRFVVDGFANYSDKLSRFARRSSDQGWIDAEPRPGKRDGAFCTGIQRDESRVFMNFKPSFLSVSTLAHELGHAYHNVCLANRTPLQRQTPMCLAETASIFCETIIQNAALRDADRDEQMMILDGALERSSGVTVDITSRFIFEQTVMAKRQDRELSAQEMCQIMREAQIDTYGDGLDPDCLHEYAWAAKPHYYGSTYYNYPYMFGLLFGLGLYALYQNDPESFRDAYDDLLSSTGLDDAQTLANRYGFDLKSPAFWEASLDFVRRDIDRFVELVG